MVEKLDTFKTIAQLESDILLAHGYTENPLNSLPVATWYLLARERSVSPINVLLVALSDYNQKVVNYALRNSSFPDEHIDALLECYRNDEERFRSVGSTYRHKYQELLTNPKVSGEFLLRYLAMGVARDTGCGPSYIQRLWRVLKHPNAPENFLLDFLENHFPSSAYSSNDQIKAHCVSILATNPKIPDSVARYIALGSSHLVKQETLTKLVRNKGVDKEVVRLLMPDSEGRLHDGRVASVGLLSALVTNLASSSEREYVVRLLGKRSGSSLTQYLVVCFSDDKEALENVANSSKNHRVAMAAAQKTEDPEAYSVLVLLRDLPIYGGEEADLKLPRLRN